jgi:RNA polymerase sigma-70 factor (ECF subfamily)
VTERHAEQARYAGWAHRLATGDADALQELFQELYDPLWRSVMRMVGDEALARDFAQESFIRIWDRRDALDPSLSLKALLYRTVRNLALNALRDDQTRRVLLRDSGSAFRAVVPSAPVSAEAQISVRELAEQLQRCINELPPRQREALRLSRFDGLSHEEISQVMGCAPRTVNNHLVRALEQLRNRLAELGTIVTVLGLIAGGSV